MVVFSTMAPQNAQKKTPSSSSRGQTKLSSFFKTTPKSSSVEVKPRGDLIMQIDAFDSHNFRTGKTTTGGR